MRKALAIVSIITVTLLLTSSVFAAAWNLPFNVRIVQQSDSDSSGRIYNSILAALGSITNASASNPYVIKVMPGIYSEGTITMKPYVDIEGMGRESTIITSDINNEDEGACTVGTITMANNSSIRNLKVTNVGNAGAGIAAAVVFNNVTATAEEIDVLVGETDTAYGDRNSGICANGASAHAVLNNINVETRSHTGWSNGIVALNDASWTVTNSKIVSSGSGSNSGARALNCNMGSGVGTITATNIYAESRTTDDGDGVVALNAVNCKSSVSNSTLKAVNGNMNIGVDSDDTSLVNVQIYTVPGPNTEVRYGIKHQDFVTGFTKISNSLIQGGIDNLTNVKLLNNYDENFDPFPGQ